MKGMKVFLIFNENFIILYTLTESPEQLVFNNSRLLSFMVSFLFCYKENPFFPLDCQINPESINYIVYVRLVLHLIIKNFWDQPFDILHGNYHWHHISS